MFNNNIYRTITSNSIKSPLPTPSPPCKWFVSYKKNTQNENLLIFTYILIYIVLGQEGLLLSLLCPTLPLAYFSNQEKVEEISKLIQSKGAVPIFEGSVEVIIQIYCDECG